MMRLSRLAIAVVVVVGCAGVVAPPMQEKPKMFAKGTEITHAVVLKKLNEILQARGKKGTDRAGQIELLTELGNISEQHDLGSALLIKIKFSLITAFFNYSNSLATCMKQEMWNRCLENLEKLMETIFSNPNIMVGEHVAEETEAIVPPNATAGGPAPPEIQAENMTNLDQPLRVRGCILSLVERMDEEFTKIMQNADAHSQEYVDHLKDEGRVCVIVRRLQRYLEERGSPDEVCRCYLRRVLHTYYKFDYVTHGKQVTRPIASADPGKTAKSSALPGDEVKEVVKEEQVKEVKEEVVKEVKEQDALGTPTEEVELSKSECDQATSETHPTTTSTTATKDISASEPADNRKSLSAQQPPQPLTTAPTTAAAAPIDHRSELADEPMSSSELMDHLCKFIYAKDRSDRIRTCAILCHIYHHALHDRWYQARDLMLMSHLQDNIQHADPPVQILYNRTMVQLGICAFRQGMIKDSHNALLDIQSSGRAKELLGQGLLLRNMAERNQEQEKVEKRRQMPFHMHVNLELLECVYLVAAMLLEVPYMAAHEFDARRRMISKQFHHQLRVSERQPLLGPPESMREHVVAASKAMKMGDWKTCRNYILNDKMNAKVWDLFPEVDKVRSMLVRKIQEESLRTYLFTYSSVYDSISMVTLGDMFELEAPIVHSVISKMIINEELMASLDQPTLTVVMHRTEPAPLQKLALQLAEKLGNLVENNERVFDAKQGSFGYFGRGGGGDQPQRGGRDQKGGYQQRGSYQGRSYQGRSGYQNKDGYQGRGEGGGGYQGRGGGYQGRGGGYQGRGGGYQGRGYGNRDGGGYQGNRDGGYQGNRDGGYQGNRDGGYQGNRDGGYQGNRDGGYQGNRDGGYQGNRDGGYQGNRDGGGGYRNQGQRIAD